MMAFCVSFLFSPPQVEGFPWLDQVCREKGVRYQEPVLCQNPSSQAGLSCPSTVFPGVSLTLRRAYVVFVTSKNPSWNRASVKGFAPEPELWWSIFLSVLPMGLQPGLFMGQCEVHGAGKSPQFPHL